MDRAAARENDRSSDPLGAVLAGGLGTRLGGSKATIQLQRRPLISYPLEALGRALGNVVVVAKMDTELPPLPGIAVWVEPERPHHPLVGLVHALSLAGERPVVVCACDLPLVTPELVRAIAQVDPGQASAVIARAEGQLQPLLGCYRPQALGPLAAWLERGTGPLIETVMALGPQAFEVSDPTLLLNVNTPEDVLRAGSLLPRLGRSAGLRALRDQPNVKS